MVHTWKSKTACGSFFSRVGSGVRRRPVAQRCTLRQLTGPVLFFLKGTVFLIEHLEYLTLVGVRNKSCRNNNNKLSSWELEHFPILL